MDVGIMMASMYPLESSFELLSELEKLDPDAIWLPDHLMGFFHPDLWQESPLSQRVQDPDAWLDPFCALSALASRTDIPLGLGVTDSTRRRAPDVARSALTLQHMCRGGFHLGIGSGEAESLLPFGYPFDKPVGRCEEFLTELRCLLDTGRMPQGGVGRIAIPRESENGKPKVWVAGHGPRMLRLTGQYGDGWLPAWTMGADEYADKRTAIARHAEAAGRPMPECGLFRGIILGESKDHVAELFEKEPLAKLNALLIEGDRWERYGLEHPGGNDSRGLIDLIPHELDAEQLRALAPKIPFELINEHFFCGDAAEVFELYRPFIDAGLEHVILPFSIGMVGGPAEMETSMTELVRLRAMLGEV